MTYSGTQPQGSGPGRIVLLSDGVPGHKHQSSGIARWLERLGGACVHEIEVPRLTGLKRFIYLKLLARGLDDASPRRARAWLSAAGFSLSVLPEDAQAHGRETLFLSAGSSAAPFCLALARVLGGYSAVVMTPSMGTRPFDFAIVPSHDRSPATRNALTTWGAPNLIDRPELQTAAEGFFTPAPHFPRKVVALLIGGGDANYQLTPSWARDTLPPLLSAVERNGAALLATTSRRTGAAVDDAVESILGESPATRYLLLASRASDNPVPAMLGAATHVLVTEDSVSMVSEAATAGFRVGLLRVGRTPLSKVRGLLGGGAARFDALFRSLALRGLVADLGDAPDFEAFLNPDEGRTDVPFNEARRAAEWILKCWRNG